MGIEAQPKFSHYQLIDSGSGYKLEKFGSIITLRPEPQAVWTPHLRPEEWREQAHAYFTRDANNPEKGRWELKSKTPESWKITYPLGNSTLTFRLGMTAFKHLGIFPEQAYNWDFIFQQCQQFEAKPKVLNLFAYTGGASLAAAAAGAEVVHVDSVKQVVQWASENANLSNLQGIRWVVEDALKFVKREVKRGHHYQGIILDPPAYGRGPEGEKWVLEDQINELIQLSASLLEPSKAFIVLNLYSMGLSATIAATLIKLHLPKITNLDYGELVVTDQFGKKLPLGIFCRGCL